MKFVRESIFSSAIRSFCIAFFSIFGIAIAITLLFLLFGAGKTSKSIELSTFDYIIPETNGRKYLFNSSDPLLLRINIDTPIGMNKGITTDQVRSMLNESTKGPLKHHPIKGILLYIDSPGGGASTSESIYFALKEYALKHQIPIYAYVEGLCASGGYLIACSAEKIYASQASMVGSIGTYAKFFNVSETMQKIGVQNKTLSRGIDKTAMNPFQPWGENADQSFIPLIDAGYKQFVDIVTKARPSLDPQQLVNTYGARVFTANTAEQIGLIDGSSFQLSEATDQLAKAASIEGSYQVISMEPKGKLSDLLKIDAFSSSSHTSLQEFAKKALSTSFTRPFEVVHLFDDSTIQ